MKRFLSLFIILIFSSYNITYAGGPHFGMISAVRKKVDELKEKKEEFKTRIKSYQSTTNADGIATFTLANGESVSVKVVGQDSGNPLQGILVVLTTDGTNGVYFIVDKSGTYVPVITNATSSSEVQSQSEIRALTISWIDQIIMPIRSKLAGDFPDPLYIEEFSEHQNEPILKVLEERYDLLFSITLGELDPKIDELVAGTIAQHIIFEAFKIKATLGFSLVTMAWDIELSATYNKWADFYRNLGFKDDDIFEIYQINPYYEILGAGNYERFLVYPRASVPPSLNYATIKGKVTNTSGEVVWFGGNINLTPTGLSLVPNIIDGSYVFNNNIPLHNMVQPYFTITASFFNYGITHIKNIRLQPGKTKTVDIVLELGGGATTFYFPVIDSVSSSQSTIAPGSSVTVTCSASDLDNATLNYSWTATGGTISGNGSQVTWTAPATEGAYTITCTVTDGEGGLDEASLNIEVSGNGNKWKIETVDSGGDVGQCTSIALDSSDNPRISYWDATNDDLKYAKYDGSSWNIGTVDSVGSVGRHTSMALDSSDNPRISYQDWGNWDLKYAKYNGASWNIETVDSAGYVGQDTSIALDSSDNPRISYRDATNGDLKYAKYDGTSWNIETVDSAGDVGEFTSIALDSSDNPRISYFDYTNADLKYAKYDGTSWNIETVDSAGYVGNGTSIALDSSDNPRISYFDYTNGDLKYAKYDGTSWSIETVDAAGIVGDYISIALDSSDNPRISYLDYTNKDLKYAKYDGTSWNIETVDSAGSVGTNTSIALDSSDNPRISYRDSTNGDLKYAILQP